MTAGDTTALARRYRRLLLAYPRSYRRTHAPEILTTLMDAAPPDRERPRAREVRDLIGGGLRQRFRVPVGRTVVFVAVVSALVLGAFGSAVGSALGWATAKPAPDSETFRAIVAADPDRWRPETDSQVFGLRSRIMAGMVVNDGWNVDTTRARLAADGWRVGPVESRQVQQDDGTSDIGHTFVAARDGTEVMVSVLDGYGFVQAQGAEPAVLLPFMLTGFVVGLLGGWLLTARLGYRVRRMRPAPQMLALTAATTAVGALGLSVLPAFLALGEHLVPRTALERFGGTPAFPGTSYGAPVDVITATGLGALAVLVILAWALGGTSGSAEPKDGLPYAA